MKKVVSLVLGLVLMMGMFAVGCGGNDSTIDPNRTQLYVGVTEGGIGWTWMEETIKDFEKENPEVQVLMTHKKQEFTGSTLLSNLKYNKFDIYFLWGCDYNAFYSSGDLLDITDAVTEKVYDAEGNLSTSATHSIIDRVVDEEFATYFNKGTDTEPKYYGIPFFSMPAGIIYDAELLNEQSLYFTKNGTIGAKLGDANIGKGPDGEEGTLDDGMPVTWNDFMLLVTIMRTSKNIVPFTWSGADEYQKGYALNQVYANYEGKENFMLNFTFNGHDTGLDEDISEENGYLVAQQEGRKAVAKFAYDILSNSQNYSSMAFKSAHTHKLAQQEYIQSADGTVKRIAFLFEGGYWETEAKNVFDAMAKTKDEWGFGKRDFRMLDIPKFTGVNGLKDQVNNKQSLFLSTDNSMICISKNSTQPELAKKFMQFALNRKNMSLYTQHSGTFYSYDYGMETAEVKNCTKFVQNVYKKYTDSQRYDRVYDLKVSLLRANNPTFFNDWNHGAKVNGELFLHPFAAFKNTTGLTVDKYIEHMIAYRSESEWIG